MNRHQFQNRIRSLFNIDVQIIDRMPSGEYRQFIRDPIGYFLRADDDIADLIFGEVEARQSENRKVSA